MTVADGAEGRRGEGLRVSTCKPLYTGWVNNEVLLYKTENCAQRTVIHHNGEEPKNVTATLLYQKN